MKYILISVIFIIPVILTNQVWITVSGEQVFAPLPKGQDYKLQESTTTDEWSLKGLHAIATEIALAVKKEPPYDLIGDALRKQEGKPAESITVEKVIDYEKPIIALGALSLIFAVIVPIVGIVLCCCRCRNKCGGYLDDTQMKRYPSRERQCYSLSIFLCSLLLIIGGSFILVSSGWMSNSIPTVRTVIDNSFDDVTIYKNNTFQELNQLAGEDLVQVLVIILNQVKNLTLDIVEPVFARGAPKVERLVSSVSKVANAVEKAGKDLTQIQNVVHSLVQQGESVKTTLGSAKSNITATRNKCSALQNCSSAVTFPPVDQLTVEANFSKVPNVTLTRTKVQDVIQSNLTQEATKGNDTFYEIPKKITNMTANFTTKFDNYTEEAKNVKLDVLRPLEDKVDQYLKKYVMPKKSTVSEILAPGGTVSKYDSYRHIVFVVLGGLMLFSGLVALVGVAIGIAGASRYDTPATRSRVAHTGGKILLWLAWLLFALVFFVNLLAGVTFVLGTNTSVMCHSMSNYQLFEKTIDLPDETSGYPLGKLLFNDNNVKLTLSGVLRHCKENEAPWSVLQLDRLFNLSKVLNYKDKLPSFDEVFGGLNRTVTDTPVLTETAYNEVNNSRDAGVDKVNFTQYREQLDKPIVKANLTSFTRQLYKAADQVPSGHQSIAAELNNTAKELDQLQRQSVADSEQNARELAGLVDDLSEQGKKIVDGVEQVFDSLVEIELFLKQDALHIVNEAVVKHWGQLFHTIDQYLAFVTSKVHDEVGKCKPLSNIYSQTINSVCQGYFAGLNGAWVSFGFCSLTLLLTIILCVRASKYFMIAHGSSSLDSVTIAEDLEMPWGDTVRLGPMKASNLYHQTPIGYDGYGVST